jgi:hypothetical protein
MKLYLSLFTVAILALLALPTSSQAYFTSDQTVERLTPLTALYTITYSFGHGSRDFNMPAATELDVPFAGTDNRLGYSVYSPSDSSTDVRTAAMIVSDAKWKDGFYHIPAGERATFTLVALVRTEESATPGDYGIKVDDLPFVSVINDDEVQQRLNEVELKKYVTPAVELNPVN